jgi:predicted MFS family arabinose efflux permease
VGLGACLFVSGCAISPTLVAAFARIEEAVPDSRMTEGITIFTTGLGAGLAPGAGLTGWAVDAGGYAAGFWVPALAGLCGAAVAPLTIRDQGRPTTAPQSPSNVVKVLSQT